MDADQWITTVIARAPELRKAGVATITVEGCSVQLLPDAPPDDLPIGGDTVPVDDDDPFNSPAMYPGGVVPGFKLEKAPH